MQTYFCVSISFVDKAADQGLVKGEKHGEKSLLLLSTWREIFTLIINIERVLLKLAKKVRI